MKGRKKENLIIRPPVVVVLGHIDHGKTSLLDQIRKTHVADKETGGITQHIGAYQIEENGKKITFIDTPGHEAFGAMRSRGAMVADIAILVIDACEGIKVQTKEVLSIIKKTKMPFIVALNKMDRPEAGPEKVKKELSNEGILVEDLGGEVPVVNISAKTGEGVSDLLELIVLLAEMKEPKANLSGSPEGVIIESFLDSKRGPVTTLLLNSGILRAGDIVSTPSTFGKIKKLEDFRGQIISEAKPGQPVVLLGLEEAPSVGEIIKVFGTLENAKEYLKPKKEKIIKSLEVPDSSPEKRVLNLIVKTDVRGSVEAIEEILKNLPQEEVILRILKSEVGDVNETDLKLAKEARATILGFRVKINPTARIVAEREKIKIIQTEIIYDIVEEIRKIMKRIAKPKIIRVDLGKVRVLVVFLTEKNRQIVGGKIIEGEVKKGTKIEVLSKEEVKGRGRLINLQKNKKDAVRLGKGEECGIMYEGDVKIEKGDILIIFEEEKGKVEI